MNFKTMNFFPTEAEKELEALLKDLLIHEGYSNEKVKAIREDVKQLSFLITFGRGFWAGCHHTYSLVFHQKNNSFYWIYFNGDTEKYAIMPIAENDHIFTLLENHDLQSSSGLFSDYVEQQVETKHDTSVALKDLNMNALPDYDFFMDIWSSFADDLNDTRSSFKKMFLEKKKEKRKQELQDFCNTYRNIPSRLEVDGNKVYLVFEDENQTKIPLQV